VTVSAKTREGSVRFRQPPWETELNADGGFRIHLAPAGMPLRLDASRPGRSESRDIAVEPGAALNVGTLVLATPEKEYTAMLSGRVVDADGAPVVGETVVGDRQRRAYM